MDCSIHSDSVDRTCQISGTQRKYLSANNILLSSDETDEQSIVNKTS